MPKFDGTSTKVNFESYKTKLMAVGALKDEFHQAYLKDLPTNPPGAASLDVTLATNEKLRSTAIAYLILTIEATPQDLTKPAEDDPHLAWKLLTMRY